MRSARTSIKRTAVGLLLASTILMGSSLCAATQRAPGTVFRDCASESEWEYAARGKTTTWLSWGNDDADAAEHGWYKNNAGGKTHPVGLKPSNPFGLYDMAGNVWQWTQDCYVDSYTNAPKDGRSVETPNGCMRVDRGGSWYYPSWLIRPATRERNPPEYRDLIMGFRVARTRP